MKIDINSSKLLTTLLSGSLIAVFAWMWTINERVAKIESPDSMISRVETLERLIFPIGVEYEVRKRMEELSDSEQQPTSGTGGEQPGGIDGALPISMNEGIAPSIAVPPNQAVDPKLREAAEDNVRSMIEQRSVEEANKRRGKPIKFKTKN